MVCTTSQISCTVPLLFCTCSCAEAQYFQRLPSLGITALSRRLHTACLEFLQREWDRELGVKVCKCDSSGLIDRGKKGWRIEIVDCPLNRALLYSNTDAFVANFPDARSQHTFKLASLRKTQNMTNDTAVTRLLYAILSQKCLKDVSRLISVKCFCDLLVVLIFFPVLLHPCFLVASAASQFWSP